VRFSELNLSGAFVIELERHEDIRGFFARTFCAREFGERSLETNFVQESISFNKRRGTIRGMHFQVEPHAETKTVRCTAGAVYDVIIDLRPGSPTYGKWHAVELSALNRRTLYIPVGFAHGFQTLENDSELLYQISAEFEPAAARGIRWNDPQVGINWPILEGVTISERDAALPDMSS